MPTRTVAAVALALSVGLGAAGCTATTKTAPRADTSSLPRATVAPGGSAGPMDVAFVNEAAQAAQFEVEAGRLAEGRGADQRVRQFGGLMVQDHTRQVQRLQALAREFRLTPQFRPAGAAQSMVTLWSSLRGGAFDCSYLPAQYLGHQAVVAAYQAEAARGENASIRAFASGELPMLTAHLNQAGQDLTGLRCTASG